MYRTNSGSDHTVSLGAEVLLAGYAYHTKRHYTAERDGLPSYLLRLQTEGCAKALVADRTYLVKPGDLLICKPGDAYELTVGDAGPDSSSALPSSDYYLFCRGPWLDAWYARAQRPRKLSVSLEETILTLWRQIVLEQQKLPDGFRQIADYLLRALCLTIDRTMDNLDSGDAHAGTYIAFRMKNFVEQHASTQFTLEDVAQHVGLSVSRTVHLFKQVFGQTVMEYALEVRLKMACERIQFSSMSLEQAAESAGFRSYSYFHRVFRSRFGISPRQYRLLHQ